MKKEMLNQPTQLKINETLEKQFKAFYQELEQDKCYDAMEFRLRFQKKLYAYIATSCPLIAEDLKTMKNHYILTKTKNV